MRQLSLDMLRKFTYNIVPLRGIKNKVDVKWVRPPYVPAYKPEKSGDLEATTPIATTALGKYYALSEEIKDAPESVKRLFSVEHLGKKAYNILVKDSLMDRVRRHQYDYSTTPESRIARITGHIRCLQETLEKFPRNVKAKVTAQELIDKRKKLLKNLRKTDYKMYEWLLEKLNIEYKAHPESFHKLTRKESLRKLTEMHCEDICNKKLITYRNLLESQQGPFLKTKLDALKQIRSEQIELQLPVTVTEQEIGKIAKQLEEWTLKNEQKEQEKRKRRNLIEENSSI